MEPAGVSQNSQSANFVEEEQLQLQGIIERLETVYSDFIADTEALWAAFKQETEESCQARVSDLQQDLSFLQESRAQSHAVNEQFDFAYRYVTSITEQFQRK